MRFIRPTNEIALKKLFESVEHLEPTYEQIGASFLSVGPLGYRPAYYEVELGRGREIFVQSVSALKSLQSHRTKWTTVFPETRQVTVGESVIVMIGTRFLSIAAPCRIVKVVDVENYFGFAYGTLPGHPERGEESFAIRLLPQGKVRFEIRSFSSPQSLMVRSSGPIARYVQSEVTERYLRAIKKLVV